MLGALKELRSHETTAAPLGEPELLELAGIAVRGEGQLRFASPLVKELVEHHYTDWQFAGFRARKGEWDAAFEEYARLDANDRIHPKDVDEVEDTEAVIGALCMHLHESVPEGPAELKRLLLKGAELVLGFAEVSFRQHDGRWQPELNSGASAPLAKSATL